jgi:dimethylamine---corrinoid protein Co-methyltransferase
LKVRRYRMKYPTRMGDGHLEEMTADELRADFVSGSEDAADRGGIPPLTEDEYERLLELFTNPARAVSVRPGDEVVLSQDGGDTKFYIDSGSSGIGIGIGQYEALLVAERAFAQDIIEMGQSDYSVKPLKMMFAMEQVHAEEMLLATVAPLVYGFMPNVGLYYRPDGPYGNPADLLPQGKIKEAREAQEEMADHARRDMVFFTSRLAEAGIDGIDFDTSAAAGDAEFLAILEAVEELTKAFPGLGIELGMSSEFVLGMHGDLEYKGVRLAGLYPHEQVKVAEEAGVSIFGPVVNTNTSRSTAWNVSRAVTFVRACSEASNIPVHANVGMGVGGVVMCDTPPIDSVSRASVAMVEIGRVDGL